MCECLFTQRGPFACLKAVSGGDVETAVGNMLEMTFPMTAEILKTTGVYLVFGEGMRCTSTIRVQSGFRVLQ